MVILLVAISLNFAAVVAIAVVVFWLTARFVRRGTIKQSVRVAIIGGATVVAGSLMPSTAAWILASTVRSGENASPAECRGIGPRLPPMASAITYYANYFGTEAVFTISEPDFLAWLDEHEWEPHEIETPEAVDLYSLNVQLEVLNGIAVSEAFDADGGGVIIVYDRDSQRCFYHFGSH